MLKSINHGKVNMVTELSKSLSCLADVDNVSDLSNICRTYIFFTTSTELHIYWLNP